MLAEVVSVQGLVDNPYHLLVQNHDRAFLYLAPQVVLAYVPVPKLYSSERLDRVHLAEMHSHQDAAWALGAGLIGFWFFAEEEGR